jgi:uncharacterized coiled-coil DUF342 family protein
MKNLLIVFLAAFMIGFAYDGHSQMSKKEKKEWKKRIKALTPEQYKTLLDENKSMKGQVSSLQTELSGVDQTIADKDDQIAQYQTQVDDLRNQVSAAKAEAQKAAQEAAQNQRSGPQMGNIDDQVGVVFKVQIGAFKNKDLSKYLEASNNFSGETDDSGLKQYTLGLFKDYWEADTFKKYLREMGVKDAWIVSYKDGKRVPIKDVLENVGTKS